MNLFNILNLIIPSVVTISVGLFAFLVYRTQKRDYKKNVSSIILLEIQQAELTIKKISENDNIDESTSVLPNDTWSKNHHLFIEDFDYDQRVLITNFYNDCTIIEAAIKEYLDYMSISRSEKIRLIQQEASRLASEFPQQFNEEGVDTNKEVFDAAMSGYTARYFNDGTAFAPYKAKDTVMLYTGRIKGIINTPVGEKLKKLASTKLQ